jgi:peptidoglycan/LPS O-acetylase OafA/YrhL
MAASTSATPRLAWVDYLKAIALLWIFINHVAERLFGFPLIANPRAEWPPFAERLAQLQPLEGFGALDIPFNILRYIGWFGDQGVQIFILLSGFGLAYSLLLRNQGERLNLWPFYLRRAERIYPLWWAAHLLMVIPLSLLVRPLFALAEPNFYWSFLGVRFWNEDNLYYFPAAGWYVGVLIQLYLVFPALWWLLKKYGINALIGLGVILPLVIRGVGLLALAQSDYLDPWSRGAIFITRLPEFTAGMALAYWMQRSPQTTHQRLTSPLTLLGTIAAYALGVWLALDLLGMSVAPFLLGVGAFILLYNLLSLLNPVEGRKNIWTWLGEHSYALYLVHHPMVLIFVSDDAAPDSARNLIGIVIAAVATVIGALILEKMTELFVRWFSGLRAKFGITRVVVGTAMVALLLIALLVTPELIMRQTMPQEGLGWGERPSLQVDQEFGWTLKPAAETRLQWESYDYRVSANALGFPAPEYPAEKSAETLRILTTGDAFTSAEGVDTEQAWPRLLEANLGEQFPDKNVEVLNFGITGYGPNQYAEVVERFAPEYQPDIILIGFFVNEYEDVLTTTEEFQESIGFDNPPLDSLTGILNLSQLQTYLRVHVYESLKEQFLDRPNGHSYFLGNIRFLELEPEIDYYGEGRAQVIERLQDIKAVADETGAKVILALIPASVQVCAPEQLAYYPRVIDLDDSEAYDLEQPQRVTQAISDDLDLGYYDLREALAGDACLYQPRNMHWLPEGHQAAADYLSEKLIEDGWVEG